MKTRPVETVLITGGGSGMGKAVAKILGGCGMNVFVADINLTAAAGTARELTQAGGKAESFEVDISDSKSVQSLFKTLKTRAEHLDMLVHSAGILGETAFVEDMTTAQWRRMIAVNLDGAFFCCREAVRWMKEKRSGRILLFSSVASLTPTPGAVHYSAAKGGINMLGKTLAGEVAKYNIRVNIIAPGYIETPMLDAMPAGFAEHIMKKTPLKRFGKENEIAGLVKFLAGEQADFFTGQIFSPNGGLVI